MTEQPFMVKLEHVKEHENGDATYTFDMTETARDAILEDAFADMCALRCAPDTQYETQVVAEHIDTEMAKLFPVSWKALRKWQDCESCGGPSYNKLCGFC